MRRIFSARAASMLTWVMLLILVPTGFYASHVFNQLAEVRENNLRTLSKAAETTNQILSTALQNVTNLRNQPDFVCQFLARQPYLRWGGTGECEPREIDAELFQSAHLHAGTEGVQINVPAELPDPNESNSTPLDHQDALMRFDVEMDALLAAIPFSDALDLLFVVDQDGSVVHQHKPAERRDVGLLVSSLESLSIIGEEEGLSTADLKRASSVHNIRISGIDYQLLCQPLRLGLEEEASEDDSVTGPANWVLCGLVASERSLRQSLAVAPFLAIMFFAVTVFGFMTWPGIKLLWMTKKDRLYFLDLSFLLFGTLGALMLATILILGTGSFKSLSRSADDSLRQIALQLETNLQNEVEHLTQTLAAFDEAVAGVIGEDPVEIGMAPAGTSGRWLCDMVDIYSASTDPSAAELNESCLDANGKGQGARLFQARAEGMGPGTNDPGSWPIRSDFQMVFWTDCHGNQLLKATSLGRNTPRVSVEHRNYFRAVKEDRLWQPISQRGNPIERYVEPVRSITTGKFATLVSIRSQVPTQDLAAIVDPAPTKDPGQCAGTAALQAVLVSTSNAVLPPGVGFAIVDDSGTAVLHSDERRALFENLFEEIEDGTTLQSMIAARTEGKTTTNYLGRPHRVFVKPLVNFPWSVVTFADTEMVSTANLEILGHASVLSFAFLLAYILLAVVYFSIRGPEIPMWFWPGAHSGKLGHWPVVIPAIGLATLALLTILLRDHGDLLIGAVFLTPLAIFLAILIAYQRTTDDGRPKTPADTEGDDEEDPEHFSEDVQPEQVTSCIAASVLAWLAIAILPAGIFFASALEHQSLLLVRYENEYLAESLVDRNCAIDDYYRSIDRSGLCRDGSRDCQFMGRRTVTAGDMYPSTMFWPESYLNPDTTLEAWQRFARPRMASGCTGNGGAPTRGYWSLFNDLKPIYNQTILQSRYLTPQQQEDAAHNSCWNWAPGDADVPGSFEFNAGPLSCDTSVKIVSARPAIGDYYTHRLVLGMCAALLFALFLWARYGARSLFFGDLRMPLSQLRDREELERRLSLRDNSAKLRIVAVAASQRDRAIMLRGPRGMDTSEKGLFNRYDMLDYLAGSTKREELRKNLVNDLVAGTNVLLVSPVDPYSLLDTEDVPEPEDPNDTAAIQIAQDKERRVQTWRRILSRFRVITVTVNLNPPKRESSGIWQRALDRTVTRQWLRRELAALPELEPLRVLLEDEVIGSSRRNALDRIVERAFGNYTALWDACTEEEKLVLVQIAFENVVNPKQVATVRRLMQRGLLVRDPGLRIMNQSFARFIVEVQQPAEVKAWQRPETGMSWAQSRWVVLGILLLALMFLWATQRELFNTTITFLTAAAVGLPGLVKVMTSLNRLNVQGDK